MAGDWIKMRADLFTHPKVVRISSALKADTLRTVGGLMSAWCLFDAHSIDGQLSGYTSETLDAHLRWDGFSAAMIAVGWLKDDGKSLSLPDFDTHNGESAKRRAQEADRKRRDRKASASDADKKRTRGEKRRGENKEGEATFVAPDWLPSEVWSMWHNYRNARKGWTHDAKRLSALKLEKLTNKNPELAKQIIERSIENSYAGLFALDGNKGAPANRARKAL